MWKQLVSILFVAFLTFPVMLWGQCKKNNPKSNKVLLMLALNIFPEEIAKAKNGACARGEEIIIIPENYASLQGDFLNWEVAKQRYQNCGMASVKKPTLNCQKLEQDFLQLQKKLDEKKINNKPIGYKLLDETLKKINQEGKTVSSLVISGHDGAGHYHDSLGDDDLSINDVKRAFDNYPNLRDNINSAFLLGCYTATKSEVIYLKGALPNLKLIAGYYDQGPAGNNKAGHDYFFDLLQKERLISTLSSEKAVKDMLNAVSAIHNVFPGIYMQICAQDSKGIKTPEEYHYFAFNETLQDPETAEVTGIVRKAAFQKFRFDACEEKLAKWYKESDPLLSKFFHGKLMIPAETGQGSPLRAIYSLIQDLAHCKKRPPLGVASMKMLLFYRNVAKNFYRYFQPEIEKIPGMVQTLEKSLEVEALSSKVESYFNQEMVKNPANYYDVIGEKVFNLQNITAKEKQDYEKFQDMVKKRKMLTDLAALRDYFNDPEKIKLDITNPLRKGARTFIDKLTNLQTNIRLAQDNLPPDQQQNLAQAEEEVKRILHLSNNHLWALQCLPDEWHNEIKDGEVRPPNCN